MERAIPNLPADDLPTAKAFYVDQLGFKVVYEGSDDGTNGVMGLQRGGFTLHIDRRVVLHGCSPGQLLVTIIIRGLT